MNSKKNQNNRLLYGSDSVQEPVLYNYKAVNEIREAAYEIADDYYTSFIMPKEDDENPVLALGLNREIFLTFFCVAHGLASLLANNSMEYDEEQSKKMLENIFFGMLASRKGR